ncbi:MAG: peptidase domain-containing ABC transporter, partial [Bacteroidetes bacterium]|nr:peptidase domain-containing ABC transporter [Bacteroidota bacterium]
MKHIRQYDAMDCGPSCLAMIAGYYGKSYSLQYLRDSCHITKEGVSLLGITEAAHAIGLETTSAIVTPEQLGRINQPCILHWNQNHFVVLKKVGKGRKRWHIADPGHGMISLSDEKFARAWMGEGRSGGIVLFLEPGEKFYELDPSGGNSLSIRYLVKYLRAYSRQLLILFALLLLGSLITFVFPFLSRSLIDRGVSGKNIGIIKLILLAQLALFSGTIVIEIFRNWIMLVIGTKLSINIISDFLEKMLRLPMKFFETKMMGDFNQRIQDNERIEYFLTSQSLLTLFSLITFSVFLGVLSWYD